MDSINFFNLEESNDYLPMGDITGLGELSLESEMLWNSIKDAVIQEEVTSLVVQKQQNGGGNKGNSAAAEKSKGKAKQFFNNMIEFFKRLWRKFSGLVQRLIQNVQTKIVESNKFYAKNKSRISANVTDTKDVNIYSWKKNPATNSINGSDVSSVINKNKSTFAAGQALSLDKLAVEMFKATSYASFASAYQKSLRSDKREKVKVTSSEIKDAVKVLSEIKTTIQGIKQSAKDSKTATSNGIKAAKDGLKAVEKGDKRGKAVNKALIETYKNINMLINKKLNVYIKLTLERYSDAMSVIRASLKNAPKAEKAKKEKKAKKTKNESLEIDLDLLAEEIELELTGDSELDILSEDFELNILGEDLDEDSEDDDEEEDSLFEGLDLGEEDDEDSEDDDEDSEEDDEDSEEDDEDSEDDDEMLEEDFDLLF